MNLPGGDYLLFI